MQPGALTRLLLMLSIIIALGGLGLSWEVIQAYNGLGWDGVFYAAPQLSPYYVGRIIPIVLGNSLPFDTVTSWRILNLASSIASCVLWSKISDHLRLEGGRWVGFCGLFLTFQAKQFYFDPVRVDAFAELAAMAMIYAHLRLGRWALFAVTVVASFCWSTAGLTGAALLMFAGQRTERELRGLRLLAVVTAVSFLAYVICWYLRTPLRSVATGVPSYALLAVAAWPLIDRYQIRHWWGVFALIAPLIVISLAPAPTQPGYSSQILSYILWPQSGQFFLPFVSLGVYYGPVFVLAVLNWPAVVKAAKALDLTLPILVGMPFILTTEPRHFLFAWPFLVVCVSRAVDVFSWRLGVAAVLWSQFWLWVNYARWAPGTADVTEFPKQLWFMHYGFWMSFKMFALQAAALCVTAAALRFRQTKII